MIISNNFYKLELSDKSGSISSFSKHGKEFIYNGGIRPLFVIRLLDNSGGQYDVSSSAAGNIVFNKAESDAEVLVKINYSRLGGNDLNATVTLRCPKDSPNTYWNIKTENNTGLIIEWVDFPDVAVPNDLIAKGGTGRIVWPFNEGALVEDISVRERLWFSYIEPGYPSRGTAGIYPAIVQCQFMAYYCDQGGLYFGAHDPSGHVKCVEFYSIEDGIRLQFRLYPGGGAYQMDYEMVLGMFSGDWYDAADIYRSWYESEASRKTVPISENPIIPEWYGDSPVIVAYPVRGKHDMDKMDPNKLFPYINALPVIESFASRLDSRIMALLMHWEGSAPWAPPYVWPPYGGEKAFKEFSERLHEKNNLLGVYCSGIGWTEQSNLISEYNKKKQFDEENLKDVMCMSPSGDLPYSSICTGQRSGYDMCASQDFMVQTMSSEVKHMIEGGCDYVQAMDQNHGGTAYFCYSKDHGHPPAPGKWQTDAMVNLYDHFKSISEQAGKKTLFGCESAAAEPFIPGLLFSDNRYNLNYFVGTPIPLYAYIYHEYVNNFMGNQVCTAAVFNYEKSPENLLYRIAYSFCAGDMLTAVITEDGNITWNWGIGEDIALPNQDELFTLIGNLNRWRKGIGKPYLHTGKMLKPLSLEKVPLHTFKMNGRTDLVVPSLLTSCWQSSEDGSIGQIIANYTIDPLEFTVDVSERPEHEYVLYTDSFIENGIKLYADASGKIKYTVPPLSAVLIKF